MLGFSSTTYPLPPFQLIQQLVVGENTPRLQSENGAIQSDAVESVLFKDLLLCKRLIGQ